MKEIMKKILIEKMVKFLIGLFLVGILIGGVYIVLDMNNNASGIYQNYVDLAWSSSEGSKPTLKSFVRDYTAKTADTTLAVAVNVDVVGNYITSDYLQELIDMHLFRTEGVYSPNDLRDLAKALSGSAFNEYVAKFSDAAPIEPYYVTLQQEVHTESRSEMMKILNINDSYWNSYKDLYRAYAWNSPEATDISFTYMKNNNKVDISENYGICCNCGTSLMYEAEGLFDSIQSCEALNKWASNHKVSTDAYTPKADGGGFWFSNSLTSSTTWKDCNPQVGDLISIYCDNSHSDSPHVELITYIDSTYMYIAGWGSSTNILLDAVMGYDKKVPLTDTVMSHGYSSSRAGHCQYIGLWHMGVGR